MCYKGFCHPMTALGYPGVEELSENAKQLLGELFSSKTIIRNHFWSALKTIFLEKGESKHFFVMNIFSIHGLPGPLKKNKNCFSGQTVVGKRGRAAAASGRAAAAAAAAGATNGEVGSRIHQLI